MILLPGVKNLCLASVLNLVFKLQPLFDVAMTKEFTDDFCSVNTPSLSSTEAYSSWKISYTLEGGGGGEKWYRKKK